MEQNRLEVQAKVEAQVVAWLRRRLFLKGGAEVCALQSRWGSGDAGSREPPAC